MKKLNFLIFIFLISIFSISALHADYKSGGAYDIIADICINGGGGIDLSGGGYTDDGCQSLPGGTTGYAVFGTEDVWAGWTPNINNISTVTALTQPADDVWLTYSTPTFKWNYLDYDDNTQSGYQVKLSTLSDFSVTSYDSGDYSSNISSHEATSINSGKHFWCVRVRDNYWNEWSVYSSTYLVKIDTVPPAGSITSVIAHISSCTVSWDISDPADIYGTDGSGLHSAESYKLRYSTSPDFETGITTITAWLAVAETEAQTLTLVPNTTYYFQVKGKDDVDNEAWCTEIYARSTLVNPPAPSWASVWVTSISVNWTNSEPANPGDTVYIAQVSTASDFSGDIFSSTTLCSNLQSSISNLQSNTTYWGLKIGDWNIE